MVPAATEMLGFCQSLLPAMRREQLKHVSPAGGGMLHRLVDEFMRSSQHLHDQVDSLLDSKSIRGGGKSGDSESEFCMAVHGERRGKSEPLSG
jgi:hypothetical protein